MSSSRNVKMDVEDDNKQPNPTAPQQNSNNNLPTPPASTSDGSNIINKEKDSNMMTSEIIEPKDPKEEDDK